MYLLTFELIMSRFTIKLTLNYTLPKFSISIDFSMTNSINYTYTLAY